MSFEIENQQDNSKNSQKVLFVNKIGGILLELLGIGIKEKIKSIMEKEFLFIEKIPSFPMYKEINPKFKYKNIFEFEGNFFDMDDEKKKDLIEYLAWTISAFIEAFKKFGNSIDIKKYPKHYAKFKKILKEKTGYMQDTLKTGFLHTSFIDRTLLLQINENPYMIAYNTILSICEINENPYFNHKKRII